MYIGKWYRPTFSQYFYDFKPYSIRYSGVIGGFLGFQFCLGKLHYIGQ